MSRDDWGFLGDDFVESPMPETEADFATLRTLGRTIVGRSFPLQFGSTNDVGRPARTIWQVIAENADQQSTYADEGEEVEIRQSPGGRVQVKARVVRDQGRVVEIRFEKVTGRANSDAQLTRLLNLDEEASKRLIDLCLTLRSVDPSGDETIRIDEAALRTALADPRNLSAAYQLDPDRFAAIIEGDVSATDVVAIAARRKTLERFEKLLNDPQAFEEAREGKGRESVWQRFFEANPWLLGVGLSGHLFTAWDQERLERVVAGHNVTDVGKRVDALLTTTGIIRSLVFAELKLHDDDLLEGNEYRPGTWAPSRALVGGVAQSLVTAQRARDDIGSWLSVRDNDDFETGERVFSGSPRSYLVIGRLESLTRNGQIHTAKVQSFELHRSNINMPEIITYDEVLARARWALDLSIQSAFDR
ncbi:Shedu immune nuclease family protein [Paenarthrobacter ureafaciens]|uniref:Shedu immune nuclease family protein n=1 Tax=Paenarthrobacter ureafaciens TaxID=37931 RepID=UPI00191792C0|nr:Shedu immune nuclease family protein [Paenarthrobacter ureafaciens]QQQ64336.1 DUF4263 domain-containing protein [Paenarthrobacter ureafaciens]